MKYDEDKYIQFIRIGQEKIMVRATSEDKLRIRSSRQSIYNFTLLLSKMFVRFLPNKLMFLLKRFQYQCQINDLILKKGQVTGFIFRNNFGKPLTSPILKISIPFDSLSPTDYISAKIFFGALHSRPRAPQIF